MLKLSNIFKKNKEAYKNKRYIINQGGTSSTKTYSILQLLTLIAIKHQNICIDIVGQTNPHLKQGVLRDMPYICEQMDFNFEDYYNKSDKVFKPNGTINFTSFDNLGKAKGGRRDILYLNEANHIPWSIVQQLIVRTRNNVFIDYNPTDEFWAQTELLDKYKDDCELIKSTYKDNPWLEQDIIDYIESHKGDGNNNFWRVYGLGELGVAEGVIFDGYYDIQTFDYDLTDFDYIFLGQDFGYKHLNSIVMVGFKDSNISCLKEFTCTNKDTSQIIDMIDGMFPKNLTMWCDSAEPDRIQMFKNAGYNAKPVKKSVNIQKGVLSHPTAKNYTQAQIEWFRLHNVTVHSDCKQLIKELKTWQYKFDERTGLWSDEPVEGAEDTIKAMLYACNGMMYHKPIIIPQRRPF